MLRKDFETEYKLNQAILVKHFKELHEAVNFYITEQIKPELVVRVLIKGDQRSFD